MEFRQGSQEANLGGANPSRPLPIFGVRATKPEGLADAVLADDFDFDACLERFQLPGVVGIPMSAGAADGLGIIKTE